MTDRTGKQAKCPVLTDVLAVDILVECGGLDKETKKAGGQTTVFV